MVVGFILFYLGWFVPHLLELLSVSNMMSFMTGMNFYDKCDFCNILEAPIRSAVEEET